ncbi:NADP-dependent oxidoreductase domain-containing protein [Abortiporus biennis]|nr:NADP-dependent oxidoreductase domain-containing protein [Abortiporus biennis]
MSHTGTYSQVPTFTLNNGTKIPAIGLGCFTGVSKEEQEAAYHWILTALKAGYRHFDTAFIYNTEQVLGRAIKDSGIPRNEIFITTKLPWNHPGRVEWSINESLKNLGVDYVDLYLMHWPFSVHFDENNSLPRDAHGDLLEADPPIPFEKTWEDIVEYVYKTGKAKAIGVSNFSLKTLEPLLSINKTGVIPVVNQIEMHPYLVQNELKSYCEERGILIEAYTPTGYSAVLNDPTIERIATKYNATSAQVVLAWHVARGVIACPMSKSAEHQKENITLPILEKEDVDTISALDKNQRVGNPPNERNKVWAWTMEQLGWE